MNTTVASGNTANQEPRHFIARRGWGILFGGEREPGLQAGEEFYPGLFVDQVPRLLVPAAALFGALPALEVAGVVEAEDDLVLVVRITWPEYVRAEVARELGCGGRDPHDPLFELLFVPLLHPT